MDLLQSVDPIGIEAQRAIQGHPQIQSSESIVARSAFFIFRIAAVWYAFLAYREFRAASMENGVETGMGSGLIGQTAR